MYLREWRLEMADDADRHSADLAATAQDLFGSSVAVSGDTAMAVTPKDASPYTGTAYICVNGGSGWPTATLSDLARPTYDSFGYSAVMSERTVLVGAIGKDCGHSNALIYVNGRFGMADETDRHPCRSARSLTGRVR